MLVATRPTIAVCPDTFEMSSYETLPLTFDVADLLEAGETPSAPVTSLIQIDTGLDYVAGHPTAPVVQGTQLVQSVTALQAGKRYRLIIKFTAAAGKIWA